MSTGLTQIIGGGFQDPEGNLLANGYLLLVLSQDEQWTSNQGQICSGRTVKVPLDSVANVQGTFFALTSVASSTGVYSGTITGGADNAYAGATFVVAGFSTSANNGTYVCTASSLTSLTLNNTNSVFENAAATASDGGAATYIVPNDQLNPAKSYYTVTGYSAAGQLVWGPNFETVPSSPNPYNLDAWVPNPIGTTLTFIEALLLQTNGVNNGNQQQLNLVAGDNVTLTDDGIGDVTIAVTQGQVGPRPSLGAWHYWNAYQGAIANGVTSSNTMQLQGNGTETVLDGTTTEPRMGKYAFTSTPSTSSVGLNEAVTTDVTIIALSLLVDAQYRVLTPTATSAGARYWIGLSDSTNGSPVGNGVYRHDTLSTNMVAFRYSPGTDTTWQAVVGSTSPTIVDTGVTPDTTASHIFEIQISGGNALFLYDGVLKATISVSGLTNNFLSVITSDNTTNHTTSGCEVDIAWMYWESSK